MKKILTICLVALGFTTYAQKTQFQRIIGGTGDENAYSMDRTREGGYYLAGYTNTIGAGDKDAYVVKTDGLGGVLWAKSYGESKDDVAWKVKTTPDSGCVIVGTTSSFNSNNKDAFITKLDKSGSIDWTTTLSTDSIEDFYNIALSRKGDYLVCGYVANDTNSDDMLIVRIGNTGSVKWLRKIGSKGDDEAYSIVEDLKGDIVVCGVTSYDSVTAGGLKGNPGDKDMVLASLTENGTLKWMRTYGTQQSEEAWDVKVDGTNRYIVAGWGIAAGGITNDFYLMSTDTSGIVNFSNAYGTMGDDRAFTVTVLPQNNYLVSGYSDPNGNDRDVAVLRINGVGRVLRSEVIGSFDKDGHWPTEVITSREGGVVVLSTSNSFSSTNKNNFYLMRGDDQLNFNCNSRSEVFQEIPVVFSSVLLNRTSQGHKAVSRTFKVNTHTPKLDSTLCCELKAEVASSVTICKGEATNIGGPEIQGYTYTWSSVGGSYSSSTANPSVRPSETTTYKLVVSSKDSECKKDSATVTITVQDVLTDDFVQDTFFCSGDSIRLVIRPDLSSYAWNGKTLTSTDSFVNVKLGDTLYVHLFDKKGCEYRDTTIVEEKSLPNVNLGKDTTICSNLPITLSGPANMKSYDWNNGQASTRTLTTNTEQTHKLVVVDQFGCTSSDEIKILSNPFSTFTLGNDTSFCKGSSYLILGPGALGDYVWNDTASSLQNLRVDQPGTYHLTAKNSFGCPFSDTIKVDEWSLPVFTLDNDFRLCAGTERIIKGPDNMQTYLWNSGQNTQSDTARKGGQFILIVSDQNGCQYSDTVDVTEIANPIPTLGNDTIICDVDTITLSTARSYSSYEWSTGETTPTIRVWKEDTYTVTVTDAEGCKGSDSKDVDTTKCPGSVIPVLFEAVVKVYPNPARDVLHVLVDEYEQNDNIKLEIIDMNGRVTYQQEYGARYFIHEEIQVGSFKSGVYLIKLSNQNGVKQIRLMIE